MHASVLKYPGQQLTVYSFHAPGRAKSHRENFSKYSDLIPSSVTLVVCPFVSDDERAPGIHEGGGEIRAAFPGIQGRGRNFTDNDELTDRLVNCNQSLELTPFSSAWDYSTQGDPAFRPYARFFATQDWALFKEGRSPRSSHPWVREFKVAVLGWRASRGTIANVLYAMLNTVLFLPRLLSISVFTLLDDAQCELTHWFYEKHENNRVARYMQATNRSESWESEGVSIRLVPALLACFLLFIDAVLSAVFNAARFILECVLSPRHRYRLSQRSEHIFVGAFQCELTPARAQALAVFGALLSLAAFATIAFFVTPYLLGGTPPTILSFLAQHVVLPFLALAQIHLSDIAVLSASAACLAVAVGIVGFLALSLLDVASELSPQPKATVLDAGSAFPPGSPTQTRVDSAAFYLTGSPENVAAAGSPSSPLIVA